MKSCPSGSIAVALTGWINDLDGTGIEDDNWTDPFVRPHPKVMRKVFTPEDNSLDPIFVSLDQVGPKAQLRFIFELFEENLRSSKFFGDNKVIDKLFSTKMYYDVTLEATDGKVRAHKWILKMKSKYFEAMFNHELCDKNQDYFKIRAISCVVLNGILRCTHTEKVQDLGVLAHDPLLWSD